MEVKFSGKEVRLVLDNGARMEVDYGFSMPKVEFTPAGMKGFSSILVQGWSAGTIISAIKRYLEEDDKPMLAFIVLMGNTRMDLNYQMFLMTVIKFYDEHRIIKASYIDQVSEVWKSPKRAWNTIDNIRNAFRFAIRNVPFDNGLSEYLPYLRKLPAEKKVKEEIDKWIAKYVATKV